MKASSLKGSHDKKDWCKPWQKAFQTKVCVCVCVVKKKLAELIDYVQGLVG